MLSDYVSFHDSHLCLKWGFSLEIDVWRRLECMKLREELG